MNAVLPWLDVDALGLVERAPAEREPSGLVRAHADSGLRDEPRVEELPDASRNRRVRAPAVPHEVLRRGNQPAVVVPGVARRDADKHVPGRVCEAAVLLRLDQWQ